MKIGILTLPIAENYGGILQTVALYQYLSNKGHDVTLIYKNIKPNIYKNIIKGILLNIPFHNIGNIKTNAKLNANILERIQLHREFIDNEIPQISPNLITTSELRNYALKKKFNAVIVGSDQVWRKAYINDPYYLAFFLDFIPNKNTKKISYAASFGKSHWEGKNDEKKISNLLRQFDAISVRELSGIDICQKNFGIENVKLVLDPTLLQDKNFYIKTTDKYELPNFKPKKLVTYILDSSEKKSLALSKIQQNLSFTNAQTLHLKELNNTNYTFSIPEWLKYIASSEFVITDSFHGMVFSIIFEKEFIVLANPERGLDRFSSLLELLGLKDRLIMPDDLSTLSHEIIKHKIDYFEVIKKLNSLKKKSQDFLENI